MVGLHGGPWNPIAVWYRLEISRLLFQEAFPGFQSLSGLRKVSGMNGFFPYREVIE